MDMFGGLTLATKSACDVSVLLTPARLGLHQDSKGPSAFHGSPVHFSHRHCKLVDERTEARRGPGTGV